MDSMKTKEKTTSSYSVTAAMLSHLYKTSTVLLLCYTAFIFTGCKDDFKPQHKGPIIPKEVYTKDAPGNWEDIADEHTPKVVIFDDGRKQNVKITVVLKKPGKNHYIEKIAIIDESKKELKAKVFSRHLKYFEALFSLQPIPKNAKVYAKCNLHDLWIAPLQNLK